MFLKQETNICDRRFLREAARPLQLFLLVIGVPLVGTSSTTTTITKKILFWLWSAFWFILMTQSGIYMVNRRVVVVAFQAMSRIDQLTGSELTENFISALFWSTSFLTETSTHLILVLTIRSTLTRFCLALEPIDRQLGQPTLTCVRKGSLAALVFIFYTVCLILIIHG